MINSLIFLKSIVVGFAMCVPIGPIGILVIRKTITQNKYKALVPGFGSLTADIFYSTVAGFGIVIIGDFLAFHQKYFQLGAATVLLLIAINMLRTKPQRLLEKSKHVTASFIKNYLMGFFLALFNAGTLFVITTLMTALKITTPEHTLSFGLAVTTGIFLGELLWWLFLSNAAAIAKKRIGRNAPITINTFSGLFLLILSTLLIIRIVAF